MINNRKLRFGVITNNPLSKTGLGRCCKAWLPLIYETNKFDIYFLNQGQNDNDPSFSKLPWKNFGVFKNFDQNRFNQDSGYQRWVSYGNAAVEEFVVGNQLDIVMHADDIWSAENYLGTDWFNFIKENFIQWTTADSEPLLPSFKEWAQKCPNVWFWSSFAERILKEEDPIKYKNVSTMFPAFNIEYFKPLPESERQSLRQKFGIAKDEKIIIYIFRNQLRKLPHTLMEALAEYKKLYPKNKIKLLLHTGWSEGAGWPLNRIREELGLPIEDILTTYSCKKCSEWNIQPYQGEDLDCPYCNTQKSRITPGIMSQITEKELNKIYNIADGACSSATSGGSELFSQESMLAGVPFSSFPYSCGEDYVKNNFVHKIRGTFTREVGTSFKKFVPEIKSIVEFYEFIWNLTTAKKRDIIEKARKWTIDNFDSKMIAKKIEKFLDSCKPIDWDDYHKKRSELKNLNIQISQEEFGLPQDSNFIKLCYKKILNMDVPESDSGFIHWSTFLNQNKTDPANSRKSLINSFLQAAQEHNNKVAPKLSLEDLLDKNDKERCLLILKESLGDCYIISSLLPEIKLKYPNASIYLATDPKYWDVFDMNENIKACIPWSQELENEMLVTGFGNQKGLFNYFHNIGLTSQRSLNYLSSKYE